MGLHESLFGRVFSVSLLLFAVSFCYADDKTIQVVGFGECADCKESNIKTIHAFLGLGVTITCRNANGEINTRGEGKLDKDGKFVVLLPKEMVKDGKLREDCFAQLHNASATPCPTHNGIEASKIVFTNSENNEKQTLKPLENLKFSTTLCTSAFLWPFFKHPPFPKIPPFPLFKNPLIPPIPPILKKPPLPPIPTYTKPPLPLIPPMLKKSFPEIPIFQKPLFPPSLTQP
ncbi:proline-rich protein 4-like [Solanum pennellii]|uniref:Proline-rich protein 4-like n=1 Tax=Solanum pennellii TaxID=28526 RepID=A0ABM1FD65_SOLPN|nr:proline-rich protein 4-like [Solanum pennellii]